MRCAEDVFLRLSLSDGCSGSMVAVIRERMPAYPGIIPVVLHPLPQPNFYLSVSALSDVQIGFPAFRRLPFCLQAFRL